MCPKVHLETVRKHYDSPTLFSARNLYQILISRISIGILNPHYNWAKMKLSDEANFILTPRG